MIDIIIVGAGPAGLSAAIYAERAGKKALVFESYTYGGQIVNTPEIENYPGIKNISGFDYATGLYEQATGLGAEVKFEKVLSVDKKEDGKGFIVKTGKNSYEAKAVILATGAKNRHLGIDKEEALTGRGISYCATCDGAFYRGKDVAVNGGGNTAIEDAMFLSNYCSKVYVIHRREGFRAENETLESLRKKENVEFVLNASITSILGEDRLSGIEVTDKNSGEKKEIKIDGLFIAIGQEPDNKDFEELVDLDKGGYIIAGENCRTKTEGIYTAGDCRTKDVRQLVTAASDGAIAALAACSFIDA
ncbi:thioredoxin-disulfide reductase [Eubacterium ruminantium]|uniref:thioredoxin-disulfide reductase n=1 Tax=Eubacterium ruminantium TaxID=42322 RepID=UPI0015685264|nr:thioredoxin-disulfide reductase [Eubacterium ruminantium]